MRTASLILLAASAAFAQHWTPPKTPWGDPDLQGTWTSDDQRGVPFERPAKFGTRKTLTEQELADRAKENQVMTGVIDSGERPNAGFWANQKGKGVDAAAAPPNWHEFARRTSTLTSLVVDPPDGRIPPLTDEAKAQMAAAGAHRNDLPGSWLDLTMYDRCITRGVAGSIFPVIYGNGTQFVQAPGMVAIRYEMIHETRVIDLRRHEHASPNLRSYMGDAIGHWEGNTLVIETTNFIGGKVAAGVNGAAGPLYSDELKLLERFTRTSANTLRYEVTITDPKTYTAPWTVAFPITQEPGYQIYEYACHEGNYAMHNRLSAARADEAKAASSK
jgi:hypothetical protein